MSRVRRPAVRRPRFSAGGWGLGLTIVTGCGSPTTTNLPEVEVESQLTIVFRAISAGRDHTCGVAADGSAYCWGGVPDGAAGGGIENLGSVTPNAVSGNLFFVNVAACGRRTCGAATDGGAYCWGFVDADVFSSDRPTQIVSPVPFTFVGAGNGHTCGLDGEGRPHCWGVNTNGQLGNGTHAESERPLAVSLDDPLTSLAVGANHSCGITADGRGLCWGFNETGQLGDGTHEDRLTPGPVEGDHRWTQIATANVHTCGIDTDGVAWCWGFNGSGQLGDGSMDSSLVPVRVDTGDRFVDISVGANHTCALRDDGRAFCWGYNLDGQLGWDGGDLRSPVPVLVRFSLDFVHISAGFGHTCAVTAGGGAYCWGRNRNGQLGTGNQSDERFPRRVVGT